MPSNKQLDQEPNQDAEEPRKSNRGFAAMDGELQRQIARKGGQSQGKENNPGNFANDRAKASQAGRKGGEARSNNNRQ